MAVVSGDILEVVWRQTYLGQNLLNVQYFEVDTASASCEEIDVAESAFGAWVTGILPYQSTGLELVESKCTNKTTGIGFGIHTPTPSAGGVGGDGMPPYVTYSFQQNRGTLITRHGHKYVGGIPESGATNGVVILAPGDLADFASVFVDPLARSVGPDDGHNFSANPVIVGRSIVLLPNPHYEIDLAKINSITGLTFRGVSTENSRKFGHGI